MLYTSTSIMIKNALLLSTVTELWLDAMVDTCAAITLTKTGTVTMDTKERLTRQTSQSDGNWLWTCCHSNRENRVIKPGGCEGHAA